MKWKVMFWDGTEAEWTDQAEFERFADHVNVDDVLKVEVLKE